MFNPDLIIKGGAFSEPTVLYDILGKRMNIVYGRNGSGKSTIARAFREQQANRQGEPRYYELSSDRSGSLNPDDCEHIFVFNEDFIDENVKVTDGLKSIIRIGSSAKLDGPIQTAKGAIKKYRDQQSAQRQILARLDGDEKTPGSILEADKQVKLGLKKDGGYLERLQKLGEAKKLVEGIIKPVLSCDPNDSLSESISETGRKLNEDILNYLSFQKGNPVNWTLPSLSRLPNIKKVNKVLTRIVKPANLSPEDQSIIDELSRANAEFLPMTEKFVINSGLGFCPLCHQPISEDHKHTLQHRLLSFRDRTIQDFKDEVSNINDEIELLSIVLPLLPSANYGKDLSLADEKTAELNKKIDEIKQALSSKSTNPIATIPAIDETAYDKIAKDCLSALERVAKDVQEYNLTFAKRDSLKQSIDTTNIRLAYHENKSWIDSFNKRQDDAEQCKKTIQNLESAINDQKHVISTLSAQIDQVDDAREQINHYLDFIFTGKKLRLEPAGADQYKLQIRHGDSYVAIHPKSISSGERNAVALAYFFACVLEQKERDYDYRDSTLLVIDDPVSSFDSENKAGVLSLLSNQVKKVLAGNPESKVLILTHDYTTLRSLCDQRLHLFPENDKETATYMILRPNHKVKSDDCGHILETMEYYNDLQTIFLFAKFDNPEDFDTFDSMGNTIRSFAESYASRMFKCKWANLFTDDGRLKCIPEDIRDIFKSFAMRPILNSESHGVISSFEPNEVQRAARILLIYMYYSSYEHLLAFLGKYNRIEIIETWADDFRG